MESLTLGGLETGAIEDESEDPGAPPGTSTSFFDDAALLRDRENERGRNRANQRSTNLNAKRGGRDFGRAFGGGRGMRPLVKCHLCFKVVIFKIFSLFFYPKSSSSRFWWLFLLSYQN